MDTRPEERNVQFEESHTDFSRSFEAPKDMVNSVVGALHVSRTTAAVLLIVLALAALGASFYFFGHSNILSSSPNKTDIERLEASLRVKN